MMMIASPQSADWYFPAYTILEGWKALCLYVTLLFYSSSFVSCKPSRFNSISIKFLKQYIIIWKSVNQSCSELVIEQVISQRRAINYSRCVRPARDETCINASCGAVTYCRRAAAAYSISLWRPHLLRASPHNRHIKWVRRWDEHSPTYLRVWSR